MDVYKSLNIITGTVMKYPEMLKVFPDHLNPNKAGLFEGSFSLGREGASI